MNQNRRTFLKNSLALGAASLIAPELIWAKSPKKSLTILHTNDFHSRLEAFPANHKTFAGKGGIAQLKTVIDRETTNNSILLDCGDVFQGTPYFNLFGGKIEYLWMNQAGYKATTLGNHEFDLGIQHLADVFKQYAQFDLLNCNYNVSQTPLKDIVKPYNIYQIGQSKVGVIGVGIDLSDLVAEPMRKGLIYNDPISPVNHYAHLLKHKEKCDFVLVISHLGYQYNSNKIDDLKLAQNTQNIDLIMGGHTHTFLEKPTPTLNQIGKVVMVNQAHWAGLVLGKVQLEL